MSNDQRVSEKGLYSLRMRICHAAGSDLEALSVEMGKSDAYSPEMWEIGKKNDMFRPSLPTQYGGISPHLEQCFMVLEEMGKGNQAIHMSFHVANGLSWEITTEHGTEEMKNKYFPRMGTGDFFVAFTPTEPDYGSGVDIRNTAVKEGDKWVLNGRKTLISFTDICDAYYIITVSDREKHGKGGHTAFYVPAGTKGLGAENVPHMIGCRGAGHGDVIMEDVEILDEYRLGAEGEGLTVFLHALAVPRASVGVCLLGLSQRILELAIARAKDRVTFGKTLTQRQVVQQILTDMAMQVHALWLLARDCARRADQSENIEMISSIMRLHGIDTVRTVSNDCLEVFGGIGYSEDNPHKLVEYLYRDARTMWFKKGPRTVQCLTLARRVIDVNGEIRTPSYC